MSWKDRFARPGPGVAKDAPRKKGPARYFEILFRDLPSLMLAGLVTSLGFLPMLLGILLGFRLSSALLVMGMGVLGGIIAGPFLCAMFDAVLRMLRDEPAFWWHTYKKALTQDWRASMLPGGFLGLSIAAGLFLALTNIASLGNAAWAAIISLFISALVLPLWFCQIALMELPTGTLIKNSLLLAFGYVPRTLPAALIQLVYWGVVVFCLPWSLMYVPLFGVWPICLLTAQLLYIPLDKSFSIEKRVNAKREQTLSPADADEAAAEEDAEAAPVPAEADDPDREA